MTLVADRHPVASGAWNQPEPPPSLPGVDDAQQFYLSGEVRYYNVSAGAWPTYSASPQPDYVVGVGRGSLPQLLTAISGEIAYLLHLRPGWDGHRAEPVTKEALYSVIQILGLVLQPESAIPHFAPLVDGGIQIEWLAGGDDVEFEISGTGEVNVLATAANGETIAEGTLDLDQPGILAGTIIDFLGSLSARVAEARSRR